MNLLATTAKAKFGCFSRNRMILAVRHFSQKNNQEPVEYNVNEEEIFSEKKMQEAQKSIGDKLKAIKQQKANEKASGEDFVHDPSQFSFIKTTKLQNVHSGAYCYNGNRLQFTKKRPSDT